MRNKLHILIILLGIIVAGISMFVAAVLVQILLMPDISSAALIWYYLIWIALYTLIIIKIAARVFNRR